MKPQHLFFTLLMLAGVGCSPTPQAVKQQNETISENDINNTFVWPDTRVVTPADNPQECYHDKTLAAYIADTGFYDYEASCIDEQYCFVSSHIQPLKLPKEWKNNKELSDMVAFFNYMEIMHAIETDYDAYERFTYDPAEVSEEEQKEQQDPNAEIRMDFFAELDRISLESLSDKDLQKSICTFIGNIKKITNPNTLEEFNEEGMWDLTPVVNMLTETWLPDFETDSAKVIDWLKRSSPQYYLPDWMPDVFDRFLGQFAEPTLDDKMEIVNYFEEAEQFDEKLAWGFLSIGVHFLAPCEGLLQMAEQLLASGNYSPLLDPFWRAYREKYNDTYSCPSTWCYSPNLRYNHFRRMIAYTTLRHIEAHPEDELARVQYYFMVMHTNILRLNHPNPFGNSAATEAMMLYWNQMLLGY